MIAVRLPGGRLGGRGRVPHGIRDRLLLAFKGNAPDDLDAFYVMAPQDDTPQSLAASFRHDHVVRDIPAERHGDYNVRLHGYFVVSASRASPAAPVSSR